MNIAAQRIVMALCVLSSGLLVWATDRHPYDFYTLMRFVVFCSSAGAAWQFFNHGDVAWAAVLGAACLLFNPFLPVHLSRSTWEPIDLGGAVVLAAAAVKLWRDSARVLPPRF